MVQLGKLTYLNVNGPLKDGKIIPIKHEGRVFHVEALGCRCGFSGHSDDTAIVYAKSSDNIVALHASEYWNSEIVYRVEIYKESDTRRIFEERIYKSESALPESLKSAGNIVRHMFYKIFSPTPAFYNSRKVR